MGDNSVASGVSGQSGGNKIRGRASSISSNSTTGTRKPLQSEFDFSLGTTKAKVFKTLDDTIPVTFKKFYNGELYDRLLQNLLLYFIALFQYDWVAKTMERARRSHLDGYNPYIVALRLQELEEEMAVLKRDLSPIYFEIILKHSTYEKAQQDRLFYESMYGTLVDILDDALSRLSKRQEIEAEIGVLFRTGHFNVYKHRNEPARSVDKLQIKELYELKNEVTNRALNAKLLTSLYQKPPALAVQVASVTNSPLVHQCIMSPIVARAKLKDLSYSSSRKPVAKLAPTPFKEKEVSEALTAPAAPSALIGSKRFRDLIRPIVLTKGIDLSNLRDNLTVMKPSVSTEAAIGLASQERSYRTDVRRSAPTSTVPESAGLPIDETYTHLMMLKRYLLFGPTLGMPGGANPGATSGGPFRQAGLMAPTPMSSRPSMGPNQPPWGNRESSLSGSLS